MPALRQTSPPCGEQARAVAGGPRVPRQTFGCFAAAAPTLRQAGLTGARLATTGPDLRARRDAAQFLTLSQSFRSFRLWLAPQACACCAAPGPNDLERCDTTLVTPAAKTVNHTRSDFRCGNLGNVEIVRGGASRGRCALSACTCGSALQDSHLPRRRRTSTNCPR